MGWGKTRGTKKGGGGPGHRSTGTALLVVHTQSGKLARQKKSVISKAKMKVAELPATSVLLLDRKRREGEGGGKREKLPLAVFFLQAVYVTLGRDACDSRKLRDAP